MSGVAVKDAPKHLHAGHRSRMRRRFLVNGLDGFSDHEVLELLLFYAVPRQDVNPMAHALLNRFGSLPEVLNAPTEELCTIYGVGPKIARFLKLIPAVLIQTDHFLLNPTRTPLRNPADLATIMARRSVRPAAGDVYVILLDAHYDLLAVYPYSSFDELDVRELALLCLDRGSKLLTLAECVNDPAALLPEPRLERLIALQDALALLDIRLADHYRFDPLCAAPRSAARDGFLLPR